MRRIACLLLISAAAPAGGDLGDIIRVVEAREAATVPFFVAYRFRDIEPSRSFAATLAFDRGRGHWMARGAEQDQVQSWGPDSTVLLLRRTRGRRWEGARRPGAILPEQITPIDFGFSALPLLRHSKSRVLRDVRLGERDCVLVENRDAVLPIRLWLEKKRGYFPVQVIHFRPEEETTWKRREFSFLSEGTRFVPASWVVVDELVPFDDGGWFPVRGRQIDCMAPAGAGEYRADRATLRPATAADFALPERRTVRNEITGELEEHGLPPRRWTALLLLAGSCVVLLAMWVLVRRRRS